MSSMTQNQTSAIPFINFNAFDLELHNKVIIYSKMLSGELPMYSYVSIDTLVEKYLDTGINWYEYESLPLPEKIRAIVYE